MYKLICTGSHSERSKYPNSALGLWQRIVMSLQLGRWTGLSLLLSKQRMKTYPVYQVPQSLRRTTHTWGPTLSPKSISGGNGVGAHGAVSLPTAHFTETSSLFLSCRPWALRLWETEKIRSGERAPLKTSLLSAPRLPRQGAGGSWAMSKRLLGTTGGRRWGQRAGSWFYSSRVAETALTSGPSAHVPLKWHTHDSLQVIEGPSSSPKSTRISIKRKYRLINVFWSLSNGVR